MKCGDTPLHVDSTTPNRSEHTGHIFAVDDDMHNLLNGLDEGGALASGFTTVWNCMIGLDIQMHRNTDARKGEFEDVQRTSLTYMHLPQTVQISSASKRKHHSVV